MRLSSGLAAICVVAAGCGSSGNDRDIGVVRSVALRWLKASDTGDGRTYCKLLSPAVLVRAESSARQLGPTVTCPQSQSIRPPRPERERDQADRRGATTSRRWASHWRRVGDGQ
jgi:hypothetical protein